MTASRLVVANRVRSPEEPTQEARHYEVEANELADRVSRLGAFRGHQDRARILHQLTEIDQRVHSLLGYVGGKPSREKADRS